MTSLVTVIIACVLVAVVALFVYLHNKSGRKELYFLLFSTSLIVWLLLLGFLFEGERSVIYGRIIFLNTVFVSYSLYLFLKEVSKYKHGFINKINLFLALVAASISMTPYVVESLNYLNNNGRIDLVPGRGILYIPYIILVVWIALSSVIALNKGPKKTLQQKQQVRIVTFGFVAFIALTLFTNFVLPLITGNSNYTWALAINSTVLIAILAYAIVKHGFLDIRLIVARSVAYTLLLGTLGLVYGLSIFGISNLFFEPEIFNASRTIIDTVLALVLIITFQPLKKFFDRITNRIFYQDAYSSEELLDELNSILVSSLELNSLLRNSAILLSSKLKAEFTTFSISKNDDVPATIESDDNIELNVEIMDHIESLIDSKEKVISTDFLEGNQTLKDTLREHNISLLVRLDSDPDKPETNLGYMVLGPKKSGNIYNSQDIKVLEIIANELVIAIQNALLYEKIKAFNRTLQKRVENATYKLRETNEKLRKLDEAKDEFITMASHQLRTPLTTIKGYLSMMLEGDAGDLSDKQQNMIKSAFTSSNRMVYLIADLLNVSRLSTGKFVIDPKRVNLTDVVRSEVDQLERHFEAKNLKLELNLPENMPSTELDENKTRQVIMNFIDNAIYYTPEGGEITVTLEEKDKSIEFTVKDTGIGVPKEEKHKLFTKFFRAQNAKKARPDGTGLGLYLCQKVVTAQGGSIIFESEEGEGSTFGFTFPKDRVLLDPEDESEEKEESK